jgi:nitrate reductase gamma subunit
MPALALLMLGAPYAALALLMLGSILQATSWIRARGFTGYANPPLALAAGGGIRWFAERLAFNGLDHDRRLAAGARMLHWSLLLTMAFHLDLALGWSAAMSAEQRSLIAAALGIPMGSMALVGLALLVWRRLRPGELESPICGRRIVIFSHTSLTVIPFDALLAALIATGIALDALYGSRALALASSLATSILSLRPDAAAASLPLLDVHVLLACALVASLPWGPLRHFASYLAVPDMGQVGP